MPFNPAVDRGASSRGCTSTGLVWQRDTADLGHQCVLRHSLDWPGSPGPCCCTRVSGAQPRPSHGPPVARSSRPAWAWGRGLSPGGCLWRHGPVSRSSHCSLWPPRTPWTQERHARGIAVEAGASAPALAIPAVLSLEASRVPVAALVLSDEVRSPVSSTDWKGAVPATFISRHTRRCSVGGVPREQHGHREVGQDDPREAQRGVPGEPSLAPSVSSAQPSLPLLPSLGHHLVLSPCSARSSGQTAAQEQAGRGGAGRGCFPTGLKSVRRKWPDSGGFFLAISECWDGMPCQDRSPTNLSMDWEGLRAPERRLGASDNTQ